MTLTEVRIEVRKQLNDGNYGSETYTLGVTVALRPGEDDAAVVRTMTSRLRAELMAQFAASEAPLIRRVARMATGEEGDPNDAP